MLKKYFKPEYYNDITKYENNECYIIYIIVYLYFVQKGNN